MGTVKQTMSEHLEQAHTNTEDRTSQVSHEMNLREQIRQDAAFSGTFGGLYGGHPYPYPAPHAAYGQPASLQELGFGEGRYASELSQLRSGAVPSEASTPLPRSPRSCWSV